MRVVISVVVYRDDDESEGVVREVSVDGIYTADELGNYAHYLSGNVRDMVTGMASQMNYEEYLAANKRVAKAKK